MNRGQGAGGGTQAGLLAVGDRALANPERGGIRGTWVLWLTCLLAGLAATAVSEAQQARPWEQIPIPPLHAFHPQQPKRIELKNGIVIFLQEDHELPFISGSVLIPGGSRDVEPAQAGLVDLYGQAWRTSGSEKMNGDAMDEFLEARAAHIETSGDVDSTALAWDSLKGDADQVFALAMDLLFHPRFDAQKLELARQQELATIARVKLADLEEWHDRSLRGRLIVGISGDFDSEAMEAKVRAAFEGLPAVTYQPARRDEFAGPRPGVYFINKPDVNQSNVEIVALGTDRRNPDRATLAVMNDILGGGFASRLFQTVRTELGLAYAVGGGFALPYDHPGTLRVEVITKSASTVDATRASLAEIAGLKRKPFTETELKRAKDDILNSFLFRYDTPGKILRERELLEFYGYPADYLETYKAEVEKVRLQDLTAAAAKYVQPEKLAVLVVGNGAEIKPGLEGLNLGAVMPIDIAIPQPQGAAEKQQ